MNKLNAGEQPDPPPSATQEEEDLIAMAANDPLVVGAPEVRGLQFFEKLNENLATTAKGPTLNHGSQAASHSQPSAAPNSVSMFPEAPQKPPKSSPPPFSDDGGFVLPSPPSSSFPGGAGSKSGPGGVAPKNEPGNLLLFPSVPHGAHAESDPFMDLPSVPSASSSVKPKPSSKTVSAPAPSAVAPPPVAFKPNSAPGPSSSDSDSDDDGDDFNSKSGTSDALKLPPLVSFSPQPLNFVPSMQDISQAQKLSKTVYSALNFDDIDTAVRDLCLSLKALTGIDCQLQTRSSK